MMDTQTIHETSCLRATAEPHRDPEISSRPKTWGVVFRILSIGTLVMVFTVASVPKIWEPESFAMAVWRYQILPDALVNLAAMTVPWLEVVIAAALLFPRWRAAAAMMAMAMLSVFSIALLAAMARGINADCGCFSIGGGARISWLSLVRNAILVAIAVGLWWSARNETQAPPPVFGAPRN